MRAQLVAIYRKPFTFVSGAVWEIHQENDVSNAAWNAMSLWRISNTRQRIGRTSLWESRKNDVMLMSLERHWSTLVRDRAECTLEWCPSSNSMINSLADGAWLGTFLVGLGKISLQKKRRARKELPHPLESEDEEVYMMCSWISWTISKQKWPRMSYSRSRRLAASRIVLVTASVGGS